MKILVTGANGLLGGHLVRELLQDGHQVRTYVRHTSNLTTLRDLPVEICYGDVRDAHTVREAVEGCERVFHAAAVFSYSGYSRRDMESTAQDGTRTIIEAAAQAKVKQVILTSSTTVLGGSDTPVVMNESANLTDKSVPDYFRTKAIQEKEAISRAKELRVELIVANPSAFVGPFDFRPSASLATITGYLQSPIKITYPGGISLAHAQDIARGHLLLAERAAPYERHILSAENWEWSRVHATIAELCHVSPPLFKVGRGLSLIGAVGMEAVSHLTGSTPLVTRDLARQVGRYFWYDCSKATQLGYHARSPRETLAQTIEWLEKSKLSRD